MGATDVAFDIRELSIADVSAGLALSDEAGWNQTLEDWRCFLRQGTVFGMRDAEDRVIATAALLPSPPVTWISMVLVSAKWRRRGFANALMTHCIEAARARDLEPWLDATPAGAAVYRPIGFTETGLSLARLRRTSDGGGMQPRQRASAASLQRLLDADRRAMGFDRGDLIREFADRAGSSICETGGAIALVRDGRKARQIGPVYAQEESAAIGLLQDIVNAEAGSLLIDISTAHSQAHAFLLSRGFVFERPFARMRFGGGAAQATGGTTELVAVAGPEFG
ncbi:MAG: GNAT family N-acetyltransferase [Methylobacteriaceae bacterium]|nr:GNAT family N-acetyltransferase [Methylobacteriaceae bacterium]